MHPLVVVEYDGFPISEVLLAAVVAGRIERNLSLSDAFCEKGDDDDDFFWKGYGSNFMTLMFQNLLIRVISFDDKRLDDEESKGRTSLPASNLIWI